MTQVKFLTPISYGVQDKSFGKALLEDMDHYFYLGGKKAYVIPNRVANEKEVVVLGDSLEKPSCISSALKVASYFTIIIPLIVLLAKAILRHVYQFHLSTEKVETRKAVDTATSELIKLAMICREAIMTVERIRDGLPAPEGEGEGNGSFNACCSGDSASASSSSEGMYRRGGFADGTVSGAVDGDGSDTNTATYESQLGNDDETANDRRSGFSGSAGAYRLDGGAVLSNPYAAAQPFAPATRPNARTNSQFLGSPAQRTTGSGVTAYPGDQGAPTRLGSERNGWSHIDTDEKEQ